MRKRTQSTPPPQLPLWLHKASNWLAPREHRSENFSIIPKQLLFFYQRLTPLDDTSNRNYSDVRWKKSSAAPAPPSLVANWNNFPSRLDRCNRLIVGYSFAHFCRPRQKYDTNIPTPFPLPTSNTTTTSFKEKEYLITFRVGTFSLNSSTTFFS